MLCIRCQHHDRQSRILLQAAPARRSRQVVSAQVPKEVAEYKLVFSRSGIRRMKLGCLMRGDRPRCSL